MPPDFIKTKRDMKIYFRSVKILEKVKLHDLDKLRQIEKERLMISRLQHPFFVHLHWTFEDEKRLCILISTR